VAIAHFLGFQAMISITHPTGGDPQSDPDAKNLFQVMDVPIQGSVMGPGKGIVTNGKILNLSCVDRASAGYQCSMVIQRSAQTVIDSQRGYISFRATAEEAGELVRKFHLENGKAHFVSSDGKFRIVGEGDSFLLEFKN